jgi:hypothetical protein
VVTLKAAWRRWDDAPGVRAPEAASATCDSNRESARLEPLFSQTSLRGRRRR